MIRTRNPWWVVAASVLGLACSAGPVTLWLAAVFLKPVSDGLHLDRSVLTGAALLTGPLAVLCSPIQGALLDRFGGWRILTIGTVIFAAVTAMQGLMTAWVGGIYLLFVLRAIAGAGPSPPGYAFVVSRWFDGQRGLALGIALSGVGLGTSVLPPMAAFLIHNYGWRAAYLGVGVIVLVLGGIPTALLVREPDADERARMPHLAESALSGMSLREAMTRSWRFWGLALAFVVSFIVVNGMLSQVVALLMDRGEKLQAATNVLAASGVAAIFGRLASGWCADRVHASFVAVTFFLLLAMGAFLFASGLPEPAPVIGALLCGFANGAEIDLMGFFVSRYFGLRHFGKIMGTMFAIFVAVGGIGPYISTKSFDLYHTYTPAFRLYEVIVLVPVIIFALLGPYRYPARRAPTVPAGGQGVPA